MHVTTVRSYSYNGVFVVSSSQYKLDVALTVPDSSLWWSHDVFAENCTWFWNCRRNSVA